MKGTYLIIITRLLYAVLYLLHLSQVPNWFPLLGLLSILLLHMTSPSFSFLYCCLGFILACEVIWHVYSSLIWESSLWKFLWPFGSIPLCRIKKIVCLSMKVTGIWKAVWSIDAGLILEWLRRRDKGEERREIGRPILEGRTQLKHS